MSTRSRIGYMNNDGSVTSIYCHFDGYPSHVGKVLFNDYKAPSDVTRLVALGNASYLEEGGLEKCCFYTRDRSESYEDNEPWNESLKNTVGEEEYTYIFNDGEWFMYEDEKTYISLEALLKREVSEKK